MGWTFLHGPTFVIPGGQVVSNPIAPTLFNLPLPVIAAVIGFYDDPNRLASEVITPELSYDGVMPYTKLSVALFSSIIGIYVQFSFGNLGGALFRLRSSNAVAAQRTFLTFLIGN